MPVTFFRKHQVRASMSQVAVLTDSCASISENLLESLQIQPVAMYIHRVAEVLRDLVTIQREKFLRWMTTARFLPITAGLYFYTVER